ncbi:MAG TPA: hypothetical protein VI113_01455 [Alphaproteobacteria bacterium]
MNERILFVAVLSIAALSVAACEQGLQAPPGTSAAQPPGANAPANSYAIELFDQNKTVSIACDSLDFSAVAANANSADDTISVSCRTTVDGNTPDLMELVRKGKRLERALVSLGPQKGRAYKMELLDVTLAGLEIGGDLSSLAAIENLNFSSPKSRLVAAPE